MKLCLGIFVKEPIPGRVKTRLTPPLTPDQATELYRVALHETVERVQGAAYNVVLFYSGDEEYFEKAFPQLPRICQSDGDLGDRMTAALDRLHSLQPAAAALIGSDSPDLPFVQIEAAFSALGESDVVTIPASDGGYVLIGNRRPYPQVFQNIDWSTDKVLLQTCQRAVAADLKYSEQGGWEDVDDIVSLRRLLVRSPDSTTADYVRRHLGSVVEV
jgi:hypothetical protein